jgi:hypothetical protein
MKIAITGHTRGLGKNLFNHFKSLGHDVIGFNSQHGVVEIITQSKGVDLFINNAYTDDNLQLKLMHALKQQVGKMIIMGSIVTINPDPNDPLYTHNKKRLELDYLHAAIDNTMNDCDCLMLNLTSSSYQDFPTIANTIEYWLNNPSVISITFNIR